MKKEKALLLVASLFSTYLFAQDVAVNKPLNLEGAFNFRDIGGYATTDGKKVVTGKIFRSADISRLTDKDMEVLATYHLNTVIDFRGTQEAAKAPDRQLPGTNYTLCPAGSDNLPDVKQMAEQMKESDFLITMYGDPSVKYYSERYKPLFDKLLNLPEKEAGLLYHCTAGRDRTGMATALVLYTLDVPMEIIVADFVASNTYLQSMNKDLYKPMAGMTGLTAGEIEKKMELRPELLRVFFQTLTDRYGSVENFLAQELGVGEKEKALMKTKYTK